MKNYKKTSVKIWKSWRTKLTWTGWYRKQPPMVALYLFFSITLGTFTKIDQIQGHSSDQNTSKYWTHQRNVLWTQ